MKKVTEKANRRITTPQSEFGIAERREGMPVDICPSNSILQHGASV